MSRRNRDLERLGIWDLLSPTTKALFGNLDPITYSHCQRISVLARRFGSFLQFSERDLTLLIWGGYFHDIGKALVAKHILNKPSSLSTEEWQVIRSHPKIDNSLLGLPPVLEPIIPMIRSHHEHWDGSGYPDGLCGDEIPYLAQVVQILDVYDALTHMRSYKNAYSSARSLEILHAETQKGWYQAELVALFAEFIRQQAAVCQLEISLLKFSLPFEPLPISLFFGQFEAS